MKCEYCGRYARSGDRTCEGCGASLPEGREIRFIGWGSVIVPTEAGRMTFTGCFFESNHAAQGRLTELS